MRSVTDKKALILEEETRFTNSLASRIIDKPELSLWMILIPIIFVFYFYQLQRFTSSKKRFTENYLIAIKRALHAVESLEEEENPDFDKLAQTTELPEKAREQQVELFKCQSQHYFRLLNANGETYEDLIRQVYQKPNHYREYCEQLNQAEKRLNESLLSRVTEDSESISRMVTRFQIASKELRNEALERIYQLN